MQDISVGSIRCNTIYSGSRIIAHMVDGVVLGQLRVSHVENLRAEPGFVELRVLSKTPRNEQSVASSNGLPVNSSSN